MRRGVLVYAALLVGVLLWAYLVWTSEDEHDPDEGVVVLEGKPDDLESIVYDGKTAEVTITVLQDEVGRYAWASVVPKPADDAAEPAPEDPEAPADPHKPPPTDDEPAEFKLGKSGDDVVAGMAPLVARRKLEGIDDVELAELGLDPPEATLTLARKGREPKTYELGGNVFGGSNVYVRDPSDGAIYLVDAKLIGPLQAAKRTLVDRTLFPGAQKDVARVTVSDGERNVTYEQKNPEDPDARAWVRAGEDGGNPSAGAWLDKALSLTASRYVQSAEDTGELAPVFTMSIAGGNDKAVDVEVLRGFDEEGEEAFYARSGHTRGVVHLHRSLAAEAAADLESVFDGGAAADAAPEE